MPLVLIHAKVTGRSLAVSESRQRIPSRPTVSGTGGTWREQLAGPCDVQGCDGQIPAAAVRLAAMRRHLG
jgi:hypothetical protein